jgi:hypothetical protein
MTAAEPSPPPSPRPSRNGNAQGGLVARKT